MDHSNFDHTHAHNERLFRYEIKYETIAKDEKLQHHTPSSSAKLVVQRCAQRRQAVDISVVHSAKEANNRCTRKQLQQCSRYLFVRFTEAHIVSEHRVSHYTGLQQQCRAQY
eukprot:15600-Heterococcus_DN1.PRE.2